MLNPVSECNHSKSAVIDSRPSTRIGCIRWRRRECLSCGARFTTYEVRRDHIDNYIEGELNKQMKIQFGIIR